LFYSLREGQVLVKKFLTTVIILAIVIVGGGWYAKRSLIDKISEKVVLN
jgi:hypothetical protein